MKTTVSNLCNARGGLLSLGIDKTPGPRGAAEETTQVFFFLIPDPNRVRSQVVDRGTTLRYEG